MVVEWAKKTGSLVLADEIFRELCFDDSPQPSLMQALGAEQTVVVSSVIKIGYDRAAAGLADKLS